MFKIAIQNKKHTVFLLEPTFIQTQKTHNTGRSKKKTWVFFHPPIETSNEVFVHSLVELRQGPNGLTGFAWWWVLRRRLALVVFWKRSLGTQKILMGFCWTSFSFGKGTTKSHGEIGENFEETMTPQKKWDSMSERIQVKDRVKHIQIQLTCLPW